MYIYVCTVQRGNDKDDIKKHSFKIVQTLEENLGEKPIPMHVLI